VSRPSFHQCHVGKMEGSDPLASFLWPAPLCGTPEKVAEDEKVLADQLQQLEGDGVLTRKVTTTNPPQVTYSLNAEGKKLVPLMETLCDWGSAHFGIKPNLPRYATRA
jgi:hypothetical protein